MRCAIYVRVSTDKEEQKSSLENQRNLFINFVSQKGWTVHDIYVEIESGTTSKRPELQRLIADANARKFDCILAKELSRLARNGRLSYEIRDLALNKNIHIITLDNAINTLEGNTHMFGLYAWMYEQESQRISERVKHTFQIKAQRGQFKGSVPPLGYEVRDGKLYVRNDATPDIVRRIFRDYLSGKGHDRIARELTQEGIPTPSQIAGKNNASDRWGGSTVRLILTNPHYVGDLVQCRSTTKSVTVKDRLYRHPKDYIVVRNTHEPIISRKDFELVQQMIAQRKRIRPQAEVHLFTNTLFCADCGRGMHYKKHVRGYLCGSYNRYGTQFCTDHLVREEELKEAILADIRAMAAHLSSESVMKKLEENMEKQRKFQEKQLKSIENQLEKLKNRKKLAHDRHFDGEMSKSEYDEYMLRVNEEIQTLTQQKMQIEEALRKGDDLKMIQEFKESLQRFLAFNDLTPESLHRLINRIEIKADGSPRIYYRFSNPSASYLLRSINAQHSTCPVCGNMSTGWTSTVWYPPSSSSRRSRARVAGLQET